MIYIIVTIGGVWVMMKKAKMKKKKKKKKKQEEDDDEIEATNKLMKELNECFIK